MSGLLDGDELRSSWQRRIRDWSRSGLSVRAFCKRHGLPRQEFDYWHEVFRFGSQQRAATESKRALGRDDFIPDLRWRDRVESFLRPWLSWQICHAVMIVLSLVPLSWLAGHATTKTAQADVLGGLELCGTEVTQGATVCSGEQQGGSEAIPEAARHRRGFGTSLRSLFEKIIDGEFESWEDVARGRFLRDPEGNAALLEGVGIRRLECTQRQACSVRLSGSFDPRLVTDSAASEGIEDRDAALLRIDRSEGAWKLEHIELVKTREGDW